MAHLSLVILFVKVFDYQSVLDGHLTNVKRTRSDTSHVYDGWRR
jgi:hypothetical protein